MREIEVSVDEKTIVAGFNSENYSLSFIVNLRAKEGTSLVNITLSGYDVDNDEHLVWMKENEIKQENLKLQIREFSDGKYITPPIDRKLGDTANFVLNEKIKAFKRLKEELKGYIED
jgi:hypothetical protein